MAAELRQVEQLLVLERRMGSFGSALQEHMSEADRLLQRRLRELEHYIDETLSRARHMTSESEREQAARLRERAQRQASELRRLEPLIARFRMALREAEELSNRATPRACRSLRETHDLVLEYLAVQNDVAGPSLSDVAGTGIVSGIVAGKSAEVKVGESTDVKIGSVGGHVGVVAADLEIESRVYAEAQARAGHQLIVNEDEFTVGVDLEGGAEAGISAKGTVRTATAAGSFLELSLEKELVDVGSDATLGGRFSRNKREAITELGLRLGGFGLGLTGEMRVKVADADLGTALKVASPLLYALGVGELLKRRKS